MEENKLRFLFALLLLFVTIGWGLFTLNLTILAIVKVNFPDLIAAAGAGSVQGGLMILLTLTVQFYFRKAKSE